MGLLYDSQCVLKALNHSTLLNSSTLKSDFATTEMLISFNVEFSTQLAHRLLELQQFAYEHYLIHSALSRITFTT